MAGSASTVHTRVVRARRRADSRASTEPHQRAEEPVHETTPYRRDFSPEAEDRSAAHRDSLPYCELAVVNERQASHPEVARSVNLDGTTERDLPPPPALFAESSDVWTVKHEKAETSNVSTIQRPQPATTSVSTIERPQPATTNVPTIQRPQPATTNISTVKRDVESSRISTVDTTSPRARSDDELAVTAQRTRFGRGSGAQPKHGAEAAQPTRGAARAQPSGGTAAAQPKRAITSTTVEDKPPRVAGSLSWLGVVVAQPEVGAPLVIGTWLCAEFRVTSPVAKIVERDNGVLVQTVTKSRYFVKFAGDAYLVGKAGKASKVG